MTTCCKLDNQASCAALSASVAASCSIHDFKESKPSARASDTSISTFCLTYRGIKCIASTICSIFRGDQHLWPESHMMVLSPLAPLPAWCPFVQPQPATIELSQVEMWELAKYSRSEYLAKWFTYNTGRCTAQIKGNHCEYWIFQEKRSQAGPWGTTCYLS